MSGITLSASVRQNLLSLQSTASLLATTQNDLATGNKVNSALDNPTSFFTAQGLNNRASDINNLLDQIGNGVQVLQAANTGITSLQSLVSSAQSIANQVLQAPTGYSTKSSISSTAITGATAQNLLGGGTAASVTETGFSTLDVSGTGSTAFTVAVDGAAAKTITIDATTVAAYNTANASNTSVTQLNAASLSATDVSNLINSQYDAAASSTASIASVTSGQLTFTSPTTGSGSSLSIATPTGTPTSGTTGITATGTPVVGTAPVLAGQTLQITATIPGTTTATNVTFGTGNGQVSTLNGLNAALASNDLQASIDSTGVLTITTTNNAASSTIGTVSGVTQISGTAAAPVADPNSQATRSSLVAQYNQVIQNITTTAQDSSFNGINLLNGDTLNLTFDETGASKLSITGVTFNAAGLGLSSLGSTSFLDNNSANSVLSTLTQASTTLRTEASALGSNLSVVQIRQDFNKNLINVLQTGASNLTLADTNEEAADSQALSTRQSIAVSALALANSSQQSVLQLLR
jgi:flagellin